MNLIGAGFRHHIHYGSRMQSVARGNAVGLNVEFLQRIRKWKGKIHIGMGIVVVAAIQQIIVAVLLASGDGNANRGRVVMRGHHAAGRVRRHIGAARKKNQIRHLPPVQRKVDDAPLIDYLRNRRILFSTIAAAAVTFNSCATPPTCSATLTWTLLPTCSKMPDCE